MTVILINWHETVPSTTNPLITRLALSLLHVVHRYFFSLNKWRGASGVWFFHTNRLAFIWAIQLWFYVFWPYLFQMNEKLLSSKIYPSIHNPNNPSIFNIKIFNTGGRVFFSVSFIFIFFGWGMQHTYRYIYLEYKYHLIVNNRSFARNLP